MKKRYIPTLLLDTSDRGSQDKADRPPAAPYRGVAKTIFTIIVWLVVFNLARLRGRMTSAESGHRVRVLLETMGGLWVKAGQLIALRRDVFGEDFCAELSKLQDKATSFSPELVRRVLEEDLLIPMSQLFDSFDMEHVAAASIGQTHKARLKREAKWVAVKVQRPQIKQQFERDMAIIRFFINFFDRAAILSFLRWKDFLAELEQTLEEELDYRLETAAIKRMRKSLRPQKIYAPKVYSKYSTRRVLIMEFIEGVFMSDYIHVANTDPERLARWQNDNHINPRKVARRLFDSLCRQVFEENLFHGDMHPGNIVLLRNSRVALIDFGSIGTLDVSFMKKYAGFSEAVAFKDYRRAADMLLLLAPSLPPIDLEEVKIKIVRWLRNWSTKAAVKSLPYHEKSFTNAMGNLSKIQSEYEIPAAWELLRIDRTWLAFDASLMHLQPEAAFMKMAERYWQGSRQRNFKRRVNVESLIADYQKLATVLTDVPQTLGDFLLHGGEMLRQRARAFQAEVSKIGHIIGLVSGLVALALFLGNLLAVLLFIHQHFTKRVTAALGSGFDDFAERFARLGPVIWIVIIVFLSVLFIGFIRVRSRALRKEILSHGNWRL